MVERRRIAAVVGWFAERYQEHGVVNLGWLVPSSLPGWIHQLRFPLEARGQYLFWCWIFHRGYYDLVARSESESLLDKPTSTPRFSGSSFDPIGDD
jgi:hypothetical protein